MLFLAVATFAFFLGEGVGGSEDECAAFRFPEVEPLCTVCAIPLPRKEHNWDETRHARLQPITKKGNYIDRSTPAILLFLQQICQGKQLSQGTTDTQTSGLSGTHITAFHPDGLINALQAPFFT